MDFVMPMRPVSMGLVAGRGHYERVIGAVRGASLSVWIATANLKHLMVEGPATVSRRGSGRRGRWRSVLEDLDQLARRGVELRILHAGTPSRAFSEALRERPDLAEGGLALRQCPRVHMKTVIVDAELLYLGSANWTGAGLGAKGAGRRNFELGIVTDDEQLIDSVQAFYDDIWQGQQCGDCGIRLLREGCSIG